MWLRGAFIRAVPRYCRRWLKDLASTERPWRLPGAYCRNTATCRRLPSCSFCSDSSTTTPRALVSLWLSVLGLRAKLPCCVESRRASLRLTGRLAAQVQHHVSFISLQNLFDAVTFPIGRLLFLQKAKPSYHPFGGS